MSKHNKDLDGSLSMGVATFLAATGRKERWARGKAEYDRLLDPGTGLVRAELTEHRNCPLCGADDYSTIFIKWGFPHVRCHHCTMIYVTPILRSEVQDAEHWSSPFNATWMSVLLSEPQRRFDAAKFAYGLDLIEGVVTQRGRILDIGCGTGHFLEIARDRGWTGVGFDLVKHMVRHAQGLDLDVRHGTLQRGAFSPGSVDAVTLWEVLDYIREPQPFLLEVARVLRPGRVLLILVENIDSIALRVMQDKSAAFGGMGRINYFNIRTLTRLLNEERFEVRHKETIISELQTLNNYLNYLDPYEGEGAEPVLIEFLTPEYIHQHLLGYKLLVLAVRR